MINAYAKAYTEVLEILKYIPEEEYKKIPKEKIEFYKNNADKDYNYVFDRNIGLEKQKISREANSIIITLFRDYFASDNQKIKLNKILNENEIKNQKELMERYNPNNLFKNKNDYQEKAIEETAVVKYEKNIIKRIVNKILSFFRSESK